MAIRQFRSVFEILKNRSPELCLAAVQVWPQCFAYMKDHERTPEVCLIAVSKYPWNIVYIKKNRTRELYNLALGINDIIDQHIINDYREFQLSQLLDN